MKIKTWKPKGTTINYRSPKIIAALRREDEVFGRFAAAKTVRIAYAVTKGALHISGILIGRIMRDEAGRWVFLPPGRRREGWYLTLGVRAGSPATIVVREIDEIDKKHVREHWSPHSVAEYMSGIKSAEDIEADINGKEKEMQ
jgi:hypothetical protein